MDGITIKEITKSINKIGKVMYDMQKDKKFKGTIVNYGVSVVKLDINYSYDYRILNLITISNLNDCNIAIELYNKISKTLKGIDFIVRYNESEEVPFKVIDRKKRQTREIRKESLQNGFDIVAINFQLNNKGKLILFGIANNYFVSEKFETLEKQLKEEISKNCDNVNIKNIEFYDNRDGIFKNKYFIKAKNWSELEEFFNIMKLKSKDHNLELLVEVDEDCEVSIFTNFGYKYGNIAIYDESSIIEESDFIKNYKDMINEFEL